MDRRGGVIAIFRRAALMALTAVTCVTFGNSAAVAEPRGNLERGIIVDLPGVDAVLYEVTENMYLLDAAGNVVGPDEAVFRRAQASLVGWARLGSPLCPAKQMVTKGVHFKTCSITADGLDNISLTTGRGTVDGSFAVVVQDDNAVDAPEFVVMNGLFRGNMDLSMRPLGTVVGNFIPSTTGVAVPFCGTFRLPFAVEFDGQRSNPRRGTPAYYLADDGHTVFPALAEEKSLRMPTVRLELKFGNKCR
jgi:hypothetical protein